MLGLFKFIQHFLNNNIGVVTFLVGFLAIYLYLKQKNDVKKGAAGLIIQEIRYAEQQIRQSGRGERGYQLSEKLLPTNSWNDNVHLFIKDLKEQQIDLINKFYSQASYIDFLITERSRQKLHPKIIRALTPTVPVMPQIIQGQETAGQQIIPEPPRIAQFSLPTPDEQMTIQILTDVSSSIEFLYNTPAVEKLRKISEKKWYNFF